MRLSDIARAGGFACAVALAAPAVAQNWQVTPQPGPLQNGDRACGLFTPYHDTALISSLAIQVGGHGSQVTLRSPQLIGLVDGLDVAIAYPSGQQQALTFRKGSSRADTATVELGTLEELEAIIEQFAVPGALQVTGNGLSIGLTLPDAAKEIAALRACLQQLAAG